MTAERRRMSRERILQGASDILNNGVYGDLTVDALARSLHMSKSTLYKYFGSKEDVIVELVDRVCAETDGAMDAFQPADASPASQLATLVEIYADHAGRLPRATVLHHLRMPDACQNRVELTRARLGKGLRDVVSAGVTRGGWSRGNASVAGTALVASAEAAMLSSARGEVQMSRGDAVRSLLALFLDGLRDSPKTS